ncbi:O-antigen polymerase [Desulfarculus baarsii DSM 2075]|uniref:O-antigen polymerase n=1 Tax=Desulfarculus baarsii (strain ATCC 33931 / DSM 2075 / LMG 7858 / VKM B-1802 / 2st14) TaxID=644282 RepID=E1QLL1_DESB2|nr:O-antigen ligase family protein [Desulfarculus baarsii]ADK86446.1 O-antigen polymerase [Desulfarculus baarsii DSM 2075]
MSFFFTLLLTALIYIRPQEYVEAIKGWPLVDYTAAACLAGVFLEGGFAAAKLKRSPVPAMLLFFWIWIGLSWLPNGWLGGVTGKFIAFSPVAINCYLIILTIDSFAKLKTYIWTLVLLCSFLVAEAMVQFYTGVGLTGSTGIQQKGVDQAIGVGIFADPNDLALNIVPLTAFLLPAFHRGLMSRGWLPGVVLLAPFVNAIILTRSRGGLLGLASVAWMYLRSRAGMIIAGVGVAMVLALMTAVPRFESIDTQESSARARLDHWAYGLSLFKSSPIFGVGQGNFIDAGSYTHTAHNSFILVLAETGFVGAFLWVGMIFCSFKQLRAMRLDDRAPPWVENFCHSMETALVGWMTCAFFLSQSFKPLLFMFMAMAVAAMNVVSNIGAEQIVAWDGKLALIIAGLTVFMIIFMHLAVRFLFNM